MTTLMSIASEPVFSFCIKCTRLKLLKKLFTNVLKYRYHTYIDFVEKHTALPDDYSKHYKWCLFI